MSTLVFSTLLYVGELISGSGMEGYEQTNNRVQYVPMTISNQCLRHTHMCHLCCLQRERRRWQWRRRMGWLSPEPSPPQNSSPSRESLSGAAPGLAQGGGRGSRS